MNPQRTVLAALIAGCLLACAQLAAATAEPQQAADPRVAELARATWRARGRSASVCFCRNTSRTRRPGSSGACGSKQRAHLPRISAFSSIVVEHATPPEAIACLKAGACDVMFLPLDARAAAVGDFSNPIFQFDYTLLVPAGSSIVRIADADRPGVRIAAVRNHASTIELSSQLKQAELVYAETPDSTFDLLRTGQAHVMASTRLALLDFSDRLPGSRVLEDRYGANINRMVVPKGKADWLAYVSEFVENAKASGLVQKAIERGGTRGVTPAPAGNAN